MLKILIRSSLLSALLLSTQAISAQEINAETCQTDFSVPIQTLCEQVELDQYETAMKAQYHQLIELLKQSSEYYEQKYRDAYYDNFEMPYDQVQETLIKSQILWQQYIDNECEVILKMSSRGTAKNILQLQCLQEQTQKREKVLSEYLKEVKLDATSLLEMPF